jgi:hypothetical protein
MNTKYEIGVVILGAAGERGAAALEILPKLRAATGESGIKLELVCLAEAKEDVRAALCGKAAALLASPCPVVGILAEAIPHALRWLADGSGRRKVVVYDATPTIYHYLHLLTLLPHTQREQIFYFGEKPLFTKEGEIDFIEHNFPGQTFFCEFIETENPAFRAAQEFIRTKGLEIQRMCFWRASCMGVSVAAGDARGGIEGGALLDKAPHDLSVAVGLMGLCGSRKWSVNQARTHLLALHESAFRLKKRDFLSVANTPLEDLSVPARIPEQFPAAALVSFDVDFTSEGKSVVPVSFLSSWLGLQNIQPERCLSDKLAGFGINTSEWVNSEEPRRSKNLRYGYHNQEVRVALLDGVLGKRRIHLAVNLLAKFGGRRFVYLFGEDRQREVIFEEEDGQNYHEQKDADLFRVFRRVIDHCAGSGGAEYVGPEAALLVHKVMLSALTRANEQVHGMNQDQAYRDALRAYGKYLTSADA